MLRLIESMFFGAVVTIALAAMCSPFFLVSYWLAATSCKARWEPAGIQTEYSFWTNCMIKVDGKFIPESRYRVTE